MILAKGGRLTLSLRAWKIFDFRISTIVSVPIDLSSDPDLASLEEKGVRAIYTSVERLQETEDGKVDWW